MQSPSTSPGLLLWRVTLQWQREVTRALAPFELTHVQFVLLATAWWLGCREGPPTQVEVARAAATDIKMTSQVLRTLESKKLLRRSADLVDGRSRRVAVTPAGGRLAAEAIAVVEAVDRSFFAEAVSGSPVDVLKSLQGEWPRGRSTSPGTRSRDA